jgi:hypothetical protein
MLQNKIPFLRAFSTPVKDPASAALKMAILASVGTWLAAEYSSTVVGSSAAAEPECISSAILTWELNCVCVCVCVGVCVYS